MDEIGQRILWAFDRLDRVSLDAAALVAFFGDDSAQSRAAVLDALPELANAGLVRDDGWGFYSRTEDGRLAVAPPQAITIYTRAQCHLCEQAKSLIAPIALEFGASVHEVDIDGDPVLLERYTNDVPVIFVGPRFFAKYRIDPEQLRRALRNATSPDS
ncbi:MAG TPA: glutaredoxin family protein [Candidatus Acidoferrum sp.]|nr:glutaredoxin family protein [Candidatus Acidoferrum sp.]